MKTCRQKRGPHPFPKPGQHLAKVEDRGRYAIVTSRIVVALEKSNRGVVIVYTRHHPNKHCRCTLTEWRRWARTAHTAARS